MRKPIASKKRKVTAPAKAVQERRRKSTPKKKTINTLAALKESQYKLSLALEAAHMGIWEWNLKTNEVAWSGKVHQIFGVSAFEGTFEHYLSLVHPADKDRLLSAVQRSLEHQEPYFVQHRIILPDGGIRWVEGRGDVLIDPKGNPVKMTGSVQDITTLRQSYLDQEDWKKRYDLIAAATGQVIYDYDVASGDIQWSGNIQEVLGYTTMEMGDINTWGSLIHKDDQPSTFAALEKAQHNQALFEVTYRFRKKNGDYIHIHDKGFFLASADNKAYRMLGTMQNVTDTKNAEALLRQSEQNYRELFDTVDEAIYIHNPDGTFADANQGACKMYGYVREDFIGKTPAFLSAENKNDFEEIGKKIALALEGTPQKFDWWGKRKNGEVFLKEVRLNKGSYYGKDILIATARDITQQHQAIDSLRESELRFRKLIQDLNVGVLIQGPHAEVLLWNKTALDLMDLSEDQLMGKTSFSQAWNAIYEDGSHFPLKDHPVPLAIRTKKPVRAVMMGVYRPVKKNLIWLLVNAEPILDLDGNIAEVVCSFTDVTERRKIEDALKESEQRFRTLQQASFGGIGLHDGGVILDCNQGLCDITGYSREELVGSNGLDLITPEWHSLVREKISSGYERTYDVEGIRKDGTRYYLEIQAKNIPYQGKRIRVTEFRDITERKKSEEKILEQNAKLLAITDDLKRKNEQLEEFTQIVSHNLRSPVGNILTLLNFFETSESQDERAEYLKLLKESGVNTLNTLHELNEVLKIKQNQNIEKQELHFETVYNQVRAMLTAQIAETDATIRIDFTEAPVIHYPRIYLESIMLNLLSNSLKYVSPDRTPVIAFKTYYHQENLMLTVSDNGMGINLDRYGHQVFKLRKTFHRHPESRGIGLFMIKNQIEAMGGEISVQSKEHVGSTFTINFTKHLTDGN